MRRRPLRRLALWLGLVQTVDDHAEQVIEAMRRHPSYMRSHDTDCECPPCRDWWNLIAGHPDVHYLEPLARQIDEHPHG